jgi:hypothetical protein
MEIQMYAPGYEARSDQENIVFDGMFQHFSIDIQQLE